MQVQPRAPQRRGVFNERGADEGDLATGIDTHNHNTQATTLLRWTRRSTHSISTPGCRAPENLAQKDTSRTGTLARPSFLLQVHNPLFHILT